MVFISTIFLLTSGFFVSEAHRMLYVREVNYSLPLAWANFAGSVFSIFQTTE